IVAGPRIVSSHAPNIFVPDNSQLNLPIPTNGTSMSSTINLNGQTGNITYVSVNVNINYPRDSDLILTLVGPGGQMITLANQRGGNSANFTNTTFDDGATTPIGAGTGPFTGIFKPEQPLSTFNGLAGTSLNGAWKLIVTDKVPGQGGILVNWSLT